MNARNSISQAGDVASDFPYSNNSVNDNIADISRKLVGTLSPDGQMELENRNNRLSQLLGELKIQVQRKREEINYKFDENDYIQRILQTEEVLQKIFYEKVLNDEKISEIYNQIIGLFPENISGLLLKKLYFEYFEDLVFLSMVDVDMQSVNEPFLSLDPQINSNFPSTSNISFTNLDLKLTNFSKEDLKSFFSFLKNHKVLDFSFKSLSNLGQDSLNEIFRNFINILWLNLTSIYLGKHSLEELSIIFKYLGSVVYLNLSENKLWNLDKESLIAIFSNLKSLKYLDLLRIGLKDFSRELLKIFFEIIGSLNLLYLNLSNNILDKLPIEELEIIFKNCKNIRHIKLSGIISLSISKEQLKAIFGNLTNVKIIDISGNKFEYDEVDYIKSLVPNAELILEKSFYN